MSIPESRVYLNLIDKQRPHMQVKRNSRILNNRPSLQLKQSLTGKYGLLNYLGQFCGLGWVNNDLRLFYQRPVVFRSVMIHRDFAKQSLKF